MKLITFVKLHLDAKKTHESVISFHSDLFNESISVRKLVR